MFEKSTIISNTAIPILQPIRRSIMSRVIAFRFIGWTRFRRRTSIQENSEGPDIEVRGKFLQRDNGQTVGRRGFQSACGVE
jgi:hypothetical protein